MCDGMICYRRESIYNEGSSSVTIYQIKRIMTSTLVLSNINWGLKEITLRKELLTDDNVCQRVVYGCHPSCNIGLMTMLCMVIECGDKLLFNIICVVRRIVPLID